MKSLAIFALAFAVAFANGGGGGKGTYSATGTKYRCFKDLGKNTSTKSEGFIINQGEKCVPKISSTCQWSWDLSYKKDSVSANSECHNPECDSNFQGRLIYNSGNGVDNYKYCVKDNQWSNIAQCVDKTAGKVVADSQCNGSNSNYYWKPKCDEKDTKQQCNEKLNKVSWFFCFNENITLKSDGRNAKKEENGYVVFEEYADFVGSANNGAGAYMNLPCYTSTSLSGGIAQEPETGGELIIIDSNTNNPGYSRVYTKISGSSASFDIFHKDSSGKFSSGLKSLICSIDGVENKQVNQNSFWDAVFGGGGYRYTYSTTNAFPETKYYTISCSGIDDSGKAVNGSVQFYAAPYMYEYEKITAKFPNDKIKDNIIYENLTSTVKKIITNKTETITHDNNQWAKKPVVRVGEDIEILLTNIKAYNKRGDIDLIKESTIETKINNTLKAISSLGVPNTANATDCGTNEPNIASRDYVFIDYNEDKSYSWDYGYEALKINSSHPILGTIELTLQDKAIREAVDAELAKGNCLANSKEENKGLCPYPAILKLVFDYQIVPHSFDIELLNHNGNELKVLYFGQGNNPQVEAPNKVKVTALGLDNNAAKSFTNQCGAQDITLDINLQGSGYSIKLVDANGNNVATIPGKDFTNGVASVDAYIKVMKDNDVEFTPNMKSEPVFSSNGFPTTVQFAGFAPYPTSYYPNYEGLSANATDMVILRARINAIDTDNVVGKLTPNDMRVYYEFQCEYCNLSKLQAITGVKDYQKQKSPTQQGWFIDSTFSEHNATTLTANMISVENQSGKVASVTNFTNGLQTIKFGTLTTPATHKVNILHGSYMNGTTAISMPNFLLYNAYWNSNNKWNTSAFIYMKGVASDEERDYGLDTGGAKNTRSGGRTGKY